MRQIPTALPERKRKKWCSWHRLNSEHKFPSNPEVLSVGQWDDLEIENIRFLGPTPESVIYLVWDVARASGFVNI